jgi:Protein of unknown function (DUF1236)
MNVRTILLGGAGVVLAQGLSAAQAQTPEGGMAPGGPPAAEKGAPGGGGGGPSGGVMAPQGEPNGGPTATESGPRKDSGKAAGKSDQMGEGETGKADKAGGEKPTATTGAKDTTEKAGTAEKGETKTEGKTGATTSEGKTGATADTKTETSAEGGKKAKVDANKVKTHFSQHRPNVKSVSKTEVSVSVGVALPSAIVLYDLPPDIIVIEGGCPIKYFLWGDDTIVLVDSCTREVVELIVIA